MALDPNAKLANIEGALRDYTATQLGSTFPVAQLDFEGEPFDETAVDEWLQCRLLEPARPNVMAGPRAPASDGTTVNRFGQQLFHFWNLNVFVRPRGQTNSLRLNTLRDTVMGAFMPNTVIAVTDVAGGTGSLGKLIVDTFERDARVPTLPVTQDQLLQWSLLVSLRWCETWT